MNDILEKYKSIIEEDYGLYVHIINALNMKNTEVLQDTGTSLLLRINNSWPVHMLLTNNTNEGINILDSVNPTAVIVHNSEIYSYLKNKDYESTICTQVYYDGPMLHINNKLNICRPHDEDISKIVKTYNIYDEEGIYAACKNGHVFAGYDGTRFFGYIGEHEEGSMGMLHIFDEYRNMGYGFELEKFIINHKLNKKEIPYGQVILGNDKSMNLQEKLGMKKSNGLIYWMWKE